MGLFDRFRKQTPDASDQGRWGTDGAPKPDDYPRWDGSGVDWATHDVPAGRTELAEEIASSDDFGIDPPAEPGFDWDVALFDDVRGIVGDDCIEALPDWLESLDGIEETVWADREYIWVRGPISRHDLATAVVARLAITADPDYWTDLPDGTRIGPER